MESTKCPHCFCELEYVKTLATSNGKDAQHTLMGGMLVTTFVVVAQEYKCPKCDYRKTIFKTI